MNVADKFWKLFLKELNGSMPCLHPEKTIVVDSSVATIEKTSLVCTECKTVLSSITEN